jgi:DDE superfamily endonuclease
LRPGIHARQTHDYLRHGTATLFAALKVLEGTVIGSCLRRQRHIEFQSFLERIERATPRGREIHMILDHFSTHTYRKVKVWFAAHLRRHLHFTPTGASWQKLVGRWFAEITRKRSRRGTFHTVSELNPARRFGRTPPLGKECQ